MHFSSGANLPFSLPTIKFFDAIFSIAGTAHALSEISLNVADVLVTTGVLGVFSFFSSVLLTVLVVLVVSLLLVVFVLFVVVFFETLLLTVPDTFTII